MQTKEGGEAYKQRLSVVNKGQNCLRVELPQTSERANGQPGATTESAVC